MTIFYIFIGILLYLGFLTQLSCGTSMTIEDDKHIYIWLLCFSTCYINA